MTAAAPLATSARTPPARLPPPVPPLRQGDRLKAAEFERRYDAMPSGVKAELLKGVVHVMASPVRFEGHGKAAALLVHWLGQYADRTPGVEVGTDGTVRLGDDDQPQPDAMMFLPRAAGGRAAVDADDYVAGPPELAVEVAYSSAGIDLGVKLEVYRDHGVQEYLVWRTGDAAVDWFRLDSGRYLPLPPDADGMLRSRVFPGLWLPVAALLAGRRKALRQAIEKGTATPDHAALVARLAAAGFAEDGP